MKIQGRIESKEVIPGEGWTRALFIIDEKKYSTFDEKIYNVFNIGDLVEMETKETVKDGKTYNNMVSMKKLEEMSELVAKGRYFQHEQKLAQNGSKHATMYVSYAKDIFCGLIELSNVPNKSNEEIMELSINLVQQAREAFE